MGSRGTVSGEPWGQQRTHLAITHLRRVAAGIFPPFFLLRVWAGKAPQQGEQHAGRHAAP